MKVSTCSYRSILVPCRLNNHDYQIDPYVGCEHSCCYCYALKQAETDWSKEVLIYKDITDQLSGELEKISPQKIFKLLIFFFGLMLITTAASAQKKTVEEAEKLMIFQLEALRAKNHKYQLLGSLSLSHGKVVGFNLE